MVVRNAMTKSVACVETDATLEQASIMMKDLDVGCLPVTQDGRLWGMLTDRDIVVRGVAGGKNLKGTRVSEIASKDVVCCHPEDAIEDAARLMEEHKVRRLVVLDEQRNIVGIVSLGDLATTMAGYRIPGEVLEHVSSDTEE